MIYQKKIAEYYLKQEIGKGSFAVVYKACRESD